MNYRHIFHAGNFADMVKHLVLLAWLDVLQQKPNPMLLLDSHAGIGQYDLTAAEAGKTNEYQDGIERIWQLPAAPLPMRALQQLIQQLNPDGKLRYYPGSPLLLHQALRPGDRLLLSELHSQDFATLQQLFRGKKQTSLLCQDGYAATCAACPPPEKRGLIVIDPPFEKTTEWRDAANCLCNSLSKWPQGHFLLWFPDKLDHASQALFDEISNYAPQRLALLRYRHHPANKPGMQRCGLLLINPPFQLRTSLAGLLDWLIQHLSPNHGSWSGTWREDGKNAAWHA